MTGRPKESWGDTSLRIIDLLYVEGRLTTGEIAGRLPDVSREAVSRSLHRLAQRGVVRRAGIDVWTEHHPPRVNPLHSMNGWTRVHVRQRVWRLA